MDIQDEGSGNRIDVAPGMAGTLLVRGDDNDISIAEPLASNHLDISVGSGNTIHIGPKCVIDHVVIYCNDGAGVELGSRIGFNGTVRLYAHEASRIEIHDSCLFAMETIVTVSDMHSVVDVATGVRINPPRDVVIGERVWVGERCYIMKGARIGSGSIIGAASVVTKEIPEHSLAAGVPAVVRRSGVTWTHELLPVPVPGEAR